jgi:hypothetical protein
MSLRVFLVFGLCAFVIATGGGATAASAAAPAPPRLRPAPGWTSIRSLLIGLSPRRSEPAASQASVIAVTAADAARLSPFALFNSLTRLRRGGIVVMATTIGPHRPSFHFARARFPLRLSSFRVDHGWENQPAANIQQRLGAVTAGGWDLDVRVYFATQHPDRKLLAEAQAELDRLRLPLA